MEFKGTKGKWTEIKGILLDEDGNRVPSKSNFSSSGRLTTEQYFGNDVEYIKSKYNDKLKAAAPEMLEMLIRLRDTEEFDITDYMDLKQLITKITE